MPLSAGTRIGSFEVLAPIGKGGMGEVYRARDSKLDRDVAIKILPESFAQDAERVARFEREAKVLAALNHPNIAIIHGLEDRAIVMELVEGPTLADRLRTGPIPLEESLTIAAQIADALEAAHERGIVHRDLKPANIKVRDDGTVKVLDFGLATAVLSGSGQPGDGANSPTLTMGATEAGVILGTAAYMSPEQASGKPVDRRADIWSFGVVLWEMLTGKRLFEGETVSHTLADVLRAPIDFDKLPKGTPAPIRELLRRCLDRETRTRLRDIGEARIAIQKWLAEPTTGSKPEIVRSKTAFIWQLGSAIAVILAVALMVNMYRRAREAAAPITLSLEIPEKANFGVRGTIPQISSDGRRVAFAPVIDGKSDLWVRDLDAPSARMLPSTSGATYPFWSPDSKWIGFFADNKLKKIAVTGGPPVTLCEVLGGRGGAWNRDDVIVYGEYQRGLSRVSARGGTPIPLHSPSTDVERYPSFLPDGKNFLYSIGTPPYGSVRIDNLDARPGVQSSREVLKADSNAVYMPSKGSSPGYLLYLRERTLVAQPFDAAKVQFTGDPVEVAARVASVSPPSGGQFSASTNGVLVYAPDVAHMKQMTWFDRKGTPVGKVGTPAETRSVSISPDGSTVAADPPDLHASHDVWLYDLSRGTTSRLTFSPLANGFPVWSPDGSRIAFAGDYNKPYIKSIVGPGAQEPLGSGNNPIWDWSRDGRWLIAAHQDPQGRLDVWALPQFGDRKPIVFLNGAYNEQHAKLSPDARWLAYSSDESSRFEVYVQSFPDHAGKWQISAEGGDYLVWSRDGHELYFIAPNHDLMAVEIKTDGKKLAPGTPRPLFKVAEPGVFDVSKDGRFLVQVPVEQDPHVALTVMLNWLAGLKK